MFPGSVVSRGNPSHARPSRPASAGPTGNAAFAPVERRSKTTSRTPRGTGRTPRGTGRTPRGTGRTPRGTSGTPRGTSQPWLGRDASAVAPDAARLGEHTGRIAAGPRATRRTRWPRELSCRRGSIVSRFIPCWDRRSRGDGVWSVPSIRSDRGKRSERQNESEGTRRRDHPGRIIAARAMYLRNRSVKLTLISSASIN